MVSNCNLFSSFHTLTMTEDMKRFPCLLNWSSMVSSRISRDSRCSLSSRNISSSIADLFFATIVE